MNEAMQVDFFRIIRVTFRRRKCSESRKPVGCQIRRGASAAVALTLVFLCCSSFAMGEGASKERIEPDFVESIATVPSRPGSLKEFLKRIEDNPTDPKAYLELARAAESLRYENEAIKAYRDAVYLSPSCLEAHLGLGRLYANPGRDAQKAMEHLNRVLELDPAHYVAHETLASIYFRLQRYPRAREHLLKMLALEPRDAVTLYRLAAVAHEEGRLEEAWQRVRQALDVDPNYEHALVLQGVLENHTGKTESARETFQRAHFLYPQNIRARYELAKILAKQDRFQEAESMLREIVDDDPFNHHALFQLLRIMLKKGDRENARKIQGSLDAVNAMGRERRNYYRSYLRHHPDTAETHLAMARVYLEIGRGNLAAQAFQRVLERDTANREALLSLAQIYMASEEYNKAREYLMRCLDLAGDKATVHGLLALCYLNLGEGTEAQRHLAATKRIDPNHPLVYRVRQLVKGRRDRSSIGPEARGASPRSATRDLETLLPSTPGQ